LKIYQLIEEFIILFKNEFILPYFKIFSLFMILNLFHNNHMELKQKLFDLKII